MRHQLALISVSLSSVFHGIFLNLSPCPVLLVHVTHLRWSCPSVSMLSSAVCARLCGRADRQLKLAGVRIEPAEVSVAAYCTTGSYQCTSSVKLVLLFLQIQSLRYCLSDSLLQLLCTITCAAQVEGVLQQVTGVTQCAVAARKMASGIEQLVAYLSPLNADPEAARAACREQLPQWMQPAAVVLLETLPQFPNGKLRSDRLPQPSEWPVAAGGRPVYEAVVVGGGFMGLQVSDAVLIECLLEIFDYPK